jgi:23S rRNA (cytosine1962-C5)-methyltransferase
MPQTKHNITGATGGDGNKEVSGAGAGYTRNIQKGTSRSAGNKEFPGTTGAGVKGSIQEVTALSAGNKEFPDTTGAGAKGSVQEGTALSAGNKEFPGTTGAGAKGSIQEGTARSERAKPIQAERAKPARAAEGAGTRDKHLSVIILKKGKEQSVRRYHPWIFSGAIASVTGNPAEGDIVEVYAWDKTYLATGHWAPGSIAVRILSFTKCNVDRAFFKKRLDDAFQYRVNSGIAGRSDTDVWRLVHGEGDGLPGLVVDVYGSVAVLQAHTAGFWHIRQMIADMIPEVTGGVVRSVYDKSEGTLPFMAKLNPVNGYLSGGLSETGTVVTENGFRFRVDWEKGQKTGFFVDQRDSRSLVRQYSKGRKVLNMFGYTGGFSVYAMSNANLVHTVDSSAAATALADENVNLNFGDDPRHRSFTTDAFNFLSAMDREYDLVILDPPAFAKHQTALNQALQGYRRLNALAMQKIKPGGILFTFSCSQVVSREDFRRSVFVAAANTGRNVRILDQTGQPADHPVNIYHPESEYLKGLVLYIE